MPKFGVEQRQEMFDHVVREMVKQNHRSEDEAGMLYSPRTKHRCHLGVLLTPQEIDLLGYYAGCTDVVRMFAMAARGEDAEFTDDEFAFFRELQEAHDRTYTRDALKEALRMTAAHHGLQRYALEEMTSEWLQQTKPWSGDL